jgi:hypothetical protein
MSQQLERERTFLAKELPQEIKTTEPTRIVDIYIPDTPAHSHLRLRQNGKTYEITKKTSVAAGDASEHIEQTIPLTEEEFAVLSRCSAKRVAKDRYRVVIDGILAEIDVFIEDLAGLVLIDFEFDTEDEKDNFIPPSIALADVTQENFIAGGLLAGKTYDTIAPELARFCYKKLNRE